MPSGKLDYAYRLSAARLVILRMRLSRFIKKRLHSEHSSSTDMKISRTMALMSLLGLVLSLATAVWVGYQLPHASQADSHKTMEVRSNPPINEQASVKTTAKTAVETNATLRALPADAELGVENVHEQNKALLDKVRTLEKSLTIRETENTSLKGLLRQKTAEMESLQSEAQALNLQVEQSAQDQASLAQDLQEQEAMYAAAEARWEAANTERKVVYNITNIPVGASVSEDQIRSDVQAIEEELPVDGALSVEATDGSAETQDDSQGYTYQFGADANDVNSTDPYRQYRDTTNDEVGWKGDDYLADSLENRSGETDGTLLDSERLGESDDSGLADFPVETGSSISGEDDVRQETFFGPAPDLYEDLEEPGMAESPGDAETYSQD